MKSSKSEAIAGDSGGPFHDVSIAVKDPFASTGRLRTYHRQLVKTLFFTWKVEIAKINQLNMNASIDAITLTMLTTNAITNNREQARQA